MTQEELLKASHKAYMIPRKYFGDQARFIGDRECAPGFIVRRYNELYVQMYCGGFHIHDGVLKENYCIQIVVPISELKQYEVRSSLQPFIQRKKA